MDSILVFGNEPDGLPPELREEILQRSPEQLLRIPVSRRCRSLNLANAVTLLVYEALRQTILAICCLSWIKPFERRCSIAASLLFSRNEKALRFLIESRFSLYAFSVALLPSVLCFSVHRLRDHLRRRKDRIHV
jgi:hypothetical protein